MIYVARISLHHYDAHFLWQVATDPRSLGARLRNSSSDGVLELAFQTLGHEEIVATMSAA